jgi:TPR repeat protein
MGDSAKVKFLRTAMRRGDADAPVRLANMYLEGKDVSRSCDQALSLLEYAAEKPNARARNRLAAMYEIGTCVQRDRVQAYRWLSAALEADSNNSWAQQNLDQTWREMTSEERTMAEAYR